MRKFFTIVMALAMSLSLSFGQGKGGKLLYSQQGEMAVDFSFPSFDGGPGMWGPGIKYSADDFDVPAGGWEVYGAKVYLSASDLDIDGIDVTFYSDNAGVPDAVVRAYVLSAANYETVDLGDGQYEYTLSFPFPGSLTEGKYWFSAVAKVMWSPANLLVLNDLTDIGLKAMQKDVSGFPSDYPNWSVKKDYQNDNGLYNNIAFALIGPPEDNDLAIKTISAPVTGVTTAAQTVTVAIENAGLLTQTGFDVKYTISKNVDNVLTEIATATETVSASIAKTEAYDYTFTQTVDMSEIAEYVVNATVLLTNDAIVENDELNVDVRNYGEVHQMGRDREVTTCVGAFVDDGGIHGNYGIGHDTLTIYPDTEGARIALDFTHWDYDAWDIDSLIFFDGPTTDAPILFAIIDRNSDYPYQNPGYIKARNATGAITIFNKTSKYAEPKYAGWIAEVSCELANSIEFIALDLELGDPAVYNITGKPVDVFATVTNAGADTVSRFVSLLENGIVVDKIETAKLIPGEVEKLHFSWIPKTASEEVNVQVIIQNDGQETNEDNVLETVVAVYPDDVLLEDFTGDTKKLPLGWVSLNGGSEVYVNSYNATHGENIMTISGIDTLVMPLMQADVLDVLRFDASLANWSDVIVLAAKSLEGPWETVSVLKATSSNMLPMEVALGNYAHEAYYFAFANTETNANYKTNIDNVRASKLFKFEKDLYALEFAPKKSIKVNNEELLNVNMMNYGIKDIAGSEYSINIKTADQIYTTVSGVDIKSEQELTVEVPVTFSAIDTLDLFVDIVMQGEERIDNNKSNTVKVRIAELNQFEPGTSGDDPNILASDEINSVTEFIYFPSEIGGYGSIKGMELTYDYQAEENLDSIPVRFYVTNYKDSVLSETSTWNAAFIETDSVAFTKVYEGLVEYEVGNQNNLFVNFDMPFEYKGDENLMVLMVKDSLPKTNRVEFNTAKSQEYRWSYGHSDNKIDTDSIVVRWNGKINTNSIPHVRWHFDNPGAPVFESTPVSTINEFEEYTYDVKVAFEGQNAFTFEPTLLPDWLTFTKVSNKEAKITGTANVVGTFPVQIAVTDGIYSSTQTFEVTCNAVPVFVSEPLAIVKANEEYLYSINVEYSGAGFAEIIGAENKPAWLTITDNGDNTATVTGTTDTHGDYEVVIKAKGDVITTEQTYVLTVGVEPVVESIDNVIIKEGLEYTQVVNVTYEGIRTLTIVEGESFPTWLTLTDNGDNTATLSATSDLVTVGEYVVNLIATDGAFEAKTSYSITVGSVPVFVSEPVTTIANYSLYNYDVVVDYNGDDALVLTADVPEWMTFTDNGDGTANLSGTPNGETLYPIAIVASGKYFFETQLFQIDVTVGINDVEAFEFNIYPNPAHSFITVTNSENATIKILDISGKMMISKESQSVSERIDVSELNTGVYFISVTNNEGTVCKRLVIE